MNLNIIKLSKDGYGFLDLDEIIDSEVHCHDIDGCYNMRADCEGCLLKGTRGLLNGYVYLHKFDIQKVNI